MHRTSGKTYALYRTLMVLSFLLGAFGAYMMLIGYGVPIPNITAQVPGAAIAGQNLPPGAILFMGGFGTSIAFGWLSNERVGKYAAGNGRN